MRAYALEIIFTSLIIIALILGWLSILAFGDTEACAALFFGQPNRRKKWSRTVIYVFGSCLLLGLLAVCFVLGGWMTTSLFKLWTSPYIQLLGS